MRYNIYWPAMGTVNILKNKLMEAQLIYGYQAAMVRLRIQWTVFKLALRHYKNPLTAFKALRHMLRQKVTGYSGGIKKMIRQNAMYYIGMYVPEIHSSNFKTFVQNELRNYLPIEKPSKRFNSIFFAITKKCALQCEHCFEWEVLNQKETLTDERIDEITDIILTLGANQLYFTGGEPTLRLPVVFDVLRKVRHTIDCWLFTSGYGLKPKIALQLKKEGLKGVVVSIDHFEKEKHNIFRGNSKSFTWATQAVQNGLTAGLLVTLSVCVTKNLASKSSLAMYMEFAKGLGAHFVQFLEPKAVGHYKGKDVSLTVEQLAEIETIFLRYNYQKAYKYYPIILYQGYHQRRIGCFNGGLTGLYIDTDGGINACPFCHTKKGNLLSPNFKETLATLTKEGCPEYGQRTAMMN